MKNEVGLQPIHFAVWGGHLDVVRVLHSYKARLDGQSTRDSVAEVTCNGGSSPLHVAALRSNVEIVNWLLEQHVKVRSSISYRTRLQTCALTAPTNPSSCLVQAVAASPLIEPTDPRIVRDEYGYTAYQVGEPYLECGSACGQKFPFT